MLSGLKNLVSYIKNEGPLNAVKTLSMTNHLSVGTLKGADQFGNKYFESLLDTVGKNRWVVYSDTKRFDGSMIPSDWHGWLHHTVDTTPVEEPRDNPLYKLNHQVNWPSNYGADANYVPPGHVARASGPQKPQYYESWKPGSKSGGQ